VADDFALAMRASRRQGMDRAFKAVKRVRLSRQHHVERFVVVVSADFALCHDDSFKMWQ
jgi:hypothetical protein